MGMVYGQWFCMTETWTTPKYSAVDQISCLVLHKHQRLTFLVHSKYCISALFGSFFLVFMVSHVGTKNSCQLLWRLNALFKKTYVRLMCCQCVYWARDFLHPVSSDRICSWNCIHCIYDKSPHLYFCCWRDNSSHYSGMSSTDPLFSGLSCSRIRKYHPTLHFVSLWFRQGGCINVFSVVPSASLDWAVTKYCIDFN